MPEAQETLKESTTPMVDLDTTGNSVDVELEDSKANTKEVETKEEPKVEVKEEKEYSGSIKVAQADRLASFSVASSWTRKDKRWSFTF